MTLNNFIATGSLTAPTRLPLQTIPAAKLQGKTITAGAWVYSTQQGLGAVKLAVGTTTLGNTRHSGSGTWEFIAVTGRVEDAATEVNIQLRTDKDNVARTGICYFSEPILVMGGQVPHHVNKYLDDADGAIAGRLTWSPPATFADGDTTPDVSEGNFFFAANIGATTITAFDGGRIGQEIKIYTTTANTTVSNSSSIQTTTGVSKVLANATVYKFIYDGTKWREF